jgi:RNA polymerase sigma-70 factor (ECF subfamily)
VADGPGRELIERLRSGDGAAFDEVYAAERDAIYRFLFRLCGRRDLAEDLFQETWMRLARHARALRLDTDLRAWLYTVARNLHRSHARWAIVDRRALARLERWWYLDGAPASHRPDERAAAGAALSRLEAALAALPSAQREVLLLAVGEGLPQDQVARLLGLSHDAVRQRLSRARAALARHLEREDPTCNAIVPVNR